MQQTPDSKARCPMMNCVSWSIASHNVRKPSIEAGKRSCVSVQHIIRGFFEGMSLDCEA